MPPIVKMKIDKAHYKWDDIWCICGNQHYFILVGGIFLELWTPLEKNT